MIARTFSGAHPFAGLPSAGPLESEASASEMQIGVAAKIKYRTDEDDARDPLRANEFQRSLRESICDKLHELQLKVDLVHPAAKGGIQGLRLVMVDLNGKRFVKTSSRAQGAHGKLHFASDENLKLHALKCLRTDAARAAGGTQPTDLPGIVEEAQFIRKYFDPDARVYQDPHNGKAYMNMQRGLISLERFNSALNLRLTVAMVRAAAVDISLVLRDMHANNDMHGDIKPDNALLMPDGTIKLTDMGMARRDNDRSPCPGTLNFLPPENILAEKSRPEWRLGDLWSLGISLCHMHCGFDRNFFEAPRAWDMLGVITTVADFSMEHRDNNGKFSLASMARSPQSEVRTYFDKIHLADPAIFEFIMDHLLLTYEQRSSAEAAHQAARGLMSASMREAVRKFAGNVERGDGALRIAMQAAWAAYQGPTSPAFSPGSERETPGALSLAGGQAGGRSLQEAAQVQQESENVAERSPATLSAGETSTRPAEHVVSPSESSAPPERASRSAGAIFRKARALSAKLFCCAGSNEAQDGA